MPSSFLMTSLAAVLFLCSSVPDESVEHEAHECPYGPQHTEPGAASPHLLLSSPMAGEESHPSVLPGGNRGTQTPTQRFGQCCGPRTPVVGHVHRVAELLGHGAGARLPFTAAPVSLPLLLLGLPPAVWSQWMSDPEVRVDQFGYRTGAEKVAVFRAPQTGWDGGSSFAPGSSVEVLRSHDDSVAFAAAPIAWGGGAEHTQSGDLVWSVDFSALDELGSFYVKDPTTGVRSEPFDIGSDVYVEVLQHSLRTFYYQRCGTPKAEPHADPRWIDHECHLGVQQDTDCRSIYSPGDPATSLDLSGGWHDAGDYNKYVNYADGTVHDMLCAFEFYPSAFDDSAGLPESGNGEPDVLDECAWELEWFLKVQLPDGSVLHKVSAEHFEDTSPPSGHDKYRFYAPPTASATISGCGVYAHAAKVYASRSSAEFQDLAVRLRTAAEAAWGWLEANPGLIPSNYDNWGFTTVPCEDEAYWQLTNRVCAAVYLFDLTGDAKYRDFLDQGLSGVHLLQWQWAHPWEWELNSALLRYSELPGASASEAAAIRAAFSGSLSGSSYLDNITNVVDPYRGWMPDGDYTWGSNRVKANFGMMFQAMPHFVLDTPNAAAYLNAGEGYVHYLHGVNPTGYTFYTNLGDSGANQSAQQLYHGWFGDGTIYDDPAVGPPPAYLQGGPNPNYTGPLQPPGGQPRQKSYLDWNTGWPENSWEVTENHIPNQAASLRMLAATAGMPQGWFSKRHGLPGGGHAPLLTGDGITRAGQSVSLSLTDAPPNSRAWLILGLYPVRVPFKGGTFVPAPDFMFYRPTDGNGADHLGPAALPSGLPPGTPIWFQYWIVDATAPRGMSGSNALLMVTQ